MSFRRLVFLLTVVAILTMAAKVTIDGDTFWHLRAGAWMVEHGQVLRTDPFSLTRAGQPWIYPGWLAELGLYATYAALGFTGLDWLTALIVLASFMLVWRVMEGPALLKAFLVILGAAASGVYWSARPQLFTLLLTAVSLVVLEIAQRGRRRLLWLLVPLSALWVNLHGGFAVLFILLGAYSAGAGLTAAIREAAASRSFNQVVSKVWNSIAIYLGVGVASAAAIGLNPDGYAMLAYPFKTVGIGVLRQYIQEWQSPDFHQLGFIPFLGLLLILLASFAYSQHKPAPQHVLLSLIFGAMAMLAARNVALFAVVVLPGLALQTDSAITPLHGLLPASRPIAPRISQVLNVVLLVVIGGAAVLHMLVATSAEANARDLRQRLPVEAVAAIRQQSPGGSLFNSYNWGGYVLWALYPEYPSFVDGRTDLFDDQLLSTYLEAWQAAPGWQDVLKQWGVHTVLIEPQAPLAAALVGQGWLETYRDPLAVVLVAPPGQ
jgi:hypothetical protein